MKIKKPMIREVVLVSLLEFICVGLMLGVFALAGYFGQKAVLGALLGGTLAVGNYGLTAVSVVLASRKAANQDVRGGTQIMRSSVLARNLLLVVLLAVAAKTGYFNVIALLLPLIFFRPILSFCELFRKPGDR